MTIAEIMKLPPGTPVPVACGMVKGVGARSAGDNPAPWSLQHLFIADGTATDGIPVKIGNHPEIPASAVGTVLYFVAHKKPTGGLSGLKIDVDRQMEGGKPKEWSVLAVARSAEILTEEQWQAKNAPAAAVQQAAAPVMQNAVTVQQNAAPVQQTTTPVQESRGPESSPSPEPPGVTTTGTGAGIRISELRYERTVNTGNYCSEKLGVTIELQPGVKGQTAFDAAKAFLESHLPPEFIPEKGVRRV